jgi:mevalonate kinase
MPAISCSAPGKVILCGEHAVVYGTPAIALPVFHVSTTVKVIAQPQAQTGSVSIKAPSIALDNSLASLEQNHPLRAAINLIMHELGIDHIPACEIQIQTTLPVSAGLGSSASVTVALTRAISTFLGHPFDNDLVNRIAYEIEKLHHGAPSGIDNTVITYGAPVFFQRGKPIEFLKITRPLTLIIADTGIKASTASAVAGVRQRWEADKSGYEAFFDEIGQLTMHIRKNLEMGAIEEIGPSLLRNHELLQQIGVSCTALDQLVTAAIQAGAWGAKLSGGGLGGNMIALANPEQAPHIAQILMHSGAAQTIITTIPATLGATS